ncbi:hypothetical protein I314_04629 [Cryptococcus bacillisporus CA1873]|uniref:Uncharacterized protein n=1 Tax=Cryptococcus bacillisporus CA1873 TaxID=1296111 RepID=A0ABR5B7R4_CRYGA|nr:hypothetical protein I314_04629 [Cryptococcus bacillisporus CA1873]|eukprot:KIR59634.1 hypothetical protein I314_04629 [Cryptococcus gattii CA1873]
MSHLSPTPFVPSKSLIPSSPSRITVRRNQLRRASSSENITVGGLANWRRKPKPSTSQSQHSVKSVGSKGSGFEVENAGKRGLGMGMQATPARKRRLTNKSSIGAMSTPKTMNSRFYSAEDDLTSSTCRSISSNELLDSAEDATSPSISANDIDPIGDSRDSIRLVDEDPLTSTILYSSESHTLFPAALDILVPLNDIASTSQRCRNMIPTSEDAFSNSECDITVPLNDVFSTPRATRIASFLQTARKIGQRQSTPYRLGGSSGLDVTSGNTTSEINNGVLDESVEFMRSKCPSPEELDCYVSDSDRRWKNDIAAFIIGTQLFKTPIRMPVVEDIFLNPQLEEFGGQEVATRAFTPIPKSTRPLSTRFLKSKRWKMADTLKSPVEHHERSWMDPFGFWWMCHVASDKSPAAYDPSSPPRPEAPRSSTPLIFPSMTSRTTLLESTDYPSHGLVSEEKEEEALIPGKWRGAKMMARMERNFVTAERGGSRTPESEHEDIGHQEQSERNNRRCFKEPEKPIQSTEEHIRQREARMQNYKDLDDHYRLKVEFVLW